jgi:hypothetical protein
MGFFSSKCSKSKISIPAERAAGLPEAASTVVVVSPKNKIIEGVYDGYGNVDGIDISDLMNDGSLRWVRKDLYKGETYAQLSPAEHCESQGYFYDEEELTLIEASLRHNARDFIVKDDPV